MYINHAIVVYIYIYIYMYTCICYMYIYIYTHLLLAMLAVSRVNPSTNTMPEPFLSNWLLIAQDLAKAALMLVSHSTW